MGMVYDSDSEPAVEARRLTFVIYDNEGQVEFEYADLPVLKELLAKLEQHAPKGDPDAD